MLSRILRGAASAEAPRFHWPAAPGCASAPPSRAAESSPDPGRLAEMREQIERGARQARQEGYREGEAAGRAKAAAEIQPVVEELARSIREIAGLRPQLMRAAAAELAQLAVGIARRVLRRELSVDPGALESLVGGALEKLAAQEVARIRTHPELEPAVRRALDGAGRSGVQVIADAALAPGSVLLDTARGTLDASLESQLAEIGRGLADRLPER